MMTREMVMELLATAGADLSIWEYSDGVRISVTVEDFEGFEEDGAEVYRDLDDEDLVDSIYDRLEASAISVSGDYYRYFEFDGFTVVWGCASFDI